MLACRIMAREGFEFTSTCLTVSRSTSDATAPGAERQSRDPTRRDSLWTVPPRLALSCISLPDLIQLSFDGEVLTPGARGAECELSRRRSARVPGLMSHLAVADCQTTSGISPCTRRCIGPETTSAQ